MNKFLTVLVLAFILSKASLAQSTISFKALGHDDEVIYGMSGSSSYYLKISQADEISGSKLVLYLEPSQAILKDHSYVNIIIGDKPAYSGRLGNDSLQKITINLTAENLSADRFLKIQVKTLLSITGDICHDMDNPALWLKVKDNSCLLLQKNKNALNNINISNCFDSETAIVYPANAGLQDLKAVAWAYAKLKKTQTRPILVFKAGEVPDSINNYIMVGKLEALPAEKRAVITVSPKPGEGLLYLSKTLAKDNTASAILFVTGGNNEGYDKAIAALGNNNITNSTFGGNLLINQAENDFIRATDENRSKISLTQIGGSSDFLSGIGSLKNAYTFKNSDFTFTPKEVEIRFIGTYSGLNPGDRGYFNIYLNGLLISSEKLDASGKLNSSVTINRYEHHKYNTLISEFRFYPTNDVCKNAFTNFFAEVNTDKSYLESKNPYVAADLSFYQYPEAFNSSATKVIISKKDAPYTAGAIGEIIYELNNNINANNFPEFDYADQVQDSDLKKYNIIALLDKDDPLMNKLAGAPVRFNQNFRLYNTDNNKTVYALSDTTSTGLAQIFYGRGNNAILVLTATGKHLSEAFLAASKSITGQLSTLASNVCVTDINYNKYLFNINKSSDNIEYIDGKGSIGHFWESYNLYVLLGILVLILLSFLYVRSKVQKSQELFID